MAKSENEWIYDLYVHISMLILNSLYFLYLPIDWFLWLWDTGFHVEWNAEIGNSHQPNSSREGTQNFDVLHGFFLCILKLNGIFKHVYICIMYSMTVIILNKYLKRGTILLQVSISTSLFFLSMFLHFMLQYNHVNCMYMNMCSYTDWYFTLSQ